MGGGERLKNLVVLIKGGGEMATGVAHRLFRSGFRICITEIPEPLSIRREVAFCEAVFDGQKEVEGLNAERGTGLNDIPQIWERGKIPVVIDPECTLRKTLRPDVLVDAIIAKKNTGTRLEDAPLVIALGPGFDAGKDVHCVIETHRGHNLGRVIESGGAEPNTGLAGEIGGYTWERVIRAPASGRVKGKKRIGDRVEVSDMILEVNGVPASSKIRGVLRGILRDGLTVDEGVKAADVDPRGIREHCFTISEKARAIGGGVLEAILRWYNQ